MVSGKFLERLRTFSLFTDLVKNSKKYQVIGQNSQVHRIEGSRQTAWIMKWTWRCIQETCVTTKLIGPWEWETVGGIPKAAQCWKRYHSKPKIEKRVEHFPHCHFSNDISNNLLQSLHMLKKLYWFKDSAFNATVFGFTSQTKAY